MVSKSRRRREAKALAAGASPVTPKGTRAAQPRRQRQSAVVALPSSSRTHSTGGARERGRDRYLHVPEVQSKTGLLTRVVFTPHQVYRLKHLAQAYQRYRVNKLTFHIVPLMSTATSGGYIAAFVRDPEDVISNSQAPNILTATQGSVTAKWWETSTVSCSAAPDLFYTANSPGQERFSSPGSFCMAVDGQASQSGSLTIYVEYDITFSMPGLESQKDSGILTAKSNLQMAAGNDYISTNSGSKKAADMFAGYKVGSILKLPSPRTYLVNQANVITGLASYLYMKINKEDEVKFCSRSGAEFGEQTFHNATVVFEGEELLVVSAPENLLTGSEFLCFQANSGSLNGLEQMSGELSSLTIETPPISGVSSIPSPSPSTRPCS